MHRLLLLWLLISVACGAGLAWRRLSLERTGDVSAPQAGLVCSSTPATPSGTTSAEHMSRNGARDVQLRSGKETDMTPDSAIFNSSSRDLLYTGMTGYRKFDSAISEIKSALDRHVSVGFLLVDCRSPMGAALQSLEKTTLVHDFDSGMEKACREGLFGYGALFQVRLREATPDLPNYSGYFIDGDAMGVVGKGSPDGAIMRLQPRSQYGSEHFAFVFEMGRTPSNKQVFDAYLADVRTMWARATPFDPRIDGKCPR